MENNYVAIMAGGIGSRFWPASRTHFPKQFLDILDTGKSFLQMTYERFTHFIPQENIFIVTASDYVDLVKEQLPEINTRNIVGEPERKNTATCIAYISHRIHTLNPDANMIVAPSDHHIEDQEQFETDCLRALDRSENYDEIVTFGIKPTYANTGYGYIECSSQLGDEISLVQRFTEKPTKEKAIEFIKAENYLWNSGIFIWRTETIISSFSKYAPVLNRHFESIKMAYYSPHEANAMRAIYRKCENTSIDYAILEKANNISVVPAKFSWTDLGTWNSLWDTVEKDDKQNAVMGNEAVLIDSEDCIVHSKDKKLVLVGGVENLIVVNTADALLICDKSKEQKIKQYLKELDPEVSLEYL